MIIINWITEISQKILTEKVIPFKLVNTTLDVLKTTAQMDSTFHHRGLKIIQGNDMT